MKKLLEALEKEEAKTDAILNEWEKNPEDKEKALEFKIAYEVEFMIYEKLVEELSEKLKIGKQTARRMITEDRKKLKAIIKKME